MTEQVEAPLAGDGTDLSGERSVAEAEYSAAERRNYQDVLDENIGALLDMMTDLKTDIQGEWDKVKTGQVSEKALKTKITSELNSLVKLTIEQESKLHDHSSERAGKAGEYALDLGQARVAVGERLARLRTAALAGRLSE